MTAREIFIPPPEFFYMLWGILLGALVAGSWEVVVFALVMVLAQWAAGLLYNLLENHDANKAHKQEFRAWKAKEEHANAVVDGILEDLNRHNAYQMYFETAEQAKQRLTHKNEETHEL